MAPVGRLSALFARGCSVREALSSDFVMCDSCCRARRDAVWSDVAGGSVSQNIITKNYFRHVLIVNVFFCTPRPVLYLPPSTSRAPCIRRTTPPSLGCTDAIYLSQRPMSMACLLSYSGVGTPLPIPYPYPSLTPPHLWFACVCL